MRLVSLDPHTFDIILSLWKSRNVSVKLWLTGDKLLQRKIASGATVIYLKNTNQVALSRLPVFLKELRYLRKLHLTRYGHHLLHRSSFLSVVQSLPRCLVELQLIVQGATRLLFRTTAASGKTVTWSIKTAFPVLESLHLSYDPEEIEWTSSMYSQLPDTLTSLKPIYQSREDEFVTLIESLPSNIRQLEVFYSPIELSALLVLISSKELTELSTDGTEVGDNLVSDPQYISLLPRTLTSIYCGQIVSPVLTQEAVSALPPSLTTLYGLEQSGDDETPLIFDHLPHLTSLECRHSASLHFSPETVKRLPRTVRVLSMVGDVDNIPVSNWPPHLTDLELSTLSKYNDRFFTSFPSGLRAFLMHDPKYGIPLKSISLLPRCLHMMRLAVCEHDSSDDNVDFPPYLHSVNITLSYDVSWVVLEPMEVPSRNKKGKSKKTLMHEAHRFLHLETAPCPPKVVACFFPFHFIPRSTEILFLNCSIPASQLIHLPPRLKTLWCLDVFVDADFNSNDTRHLSRMTELYKIGASQGIDSPASHVSLPASINSLLPRTLRCITTQGGSIWRNCDWSRLPPHLKLIVCDQSDLPVSAKLFLSAPLTRLKTLKLFLTYLTDDLVHLMPRSLLYFELTGFSNTLPKLTLACIPYWPYNLGSNHLSKPLRQAHEKLHAERVRAIGSSSKKSFPKLFPLQ